MNVLAIELVGVLVEAFDLDGSVRNIEFLLAHFSSYFKAFKGVLRLDVG